MSNENVVATDRIHKEVIESLPVILERVAKGVKILNDAGLDESLQVGYLGAETAVKKLSAWSRLFVARCEIEAEAHTKGQESHFVKEKRRNALRRNAKG